MTAPSFAQIMKQIQNKEFVQSTGLVTSKPTPVFKVDYQSTIQFAKSTQK